MSLTILGPEHLERTAVVVQAARRSPPEISSFATVGRGGSAAKRTRPAVLPPPADDVVSAPLEPDPSRGMSGIVLQIAVRVTMSCAARVREAGGERRRLAGSCGGKRITRRRDRRPAGAPGSRSSRPCCHRRRRFVGGPPGRQRVRELAMQLDERRRFVADRNDDGELNAIWLLDNLVSWLFWFCSGYFRRLQMIATDRPNVGIVSR